jgi:hypothetical protein
VVGWHAVKNKIFVGLACVFVILLTCLATAQEFQPERPVIDPQCLADDENFTGLFDALALLFAALGFLVLPGVIPLFPGAANKWKWADPFGRWSRFSLLMFGLFFLLVFLPPQIARVSPVFRPGLALFHAVGDTRFEYLDCDLHRVPKDYGFLFFMRWSPGYNLMIKYWWAQLLVFGIYAALSSGVYFAISIFVPPRRLEALAE